MNVFDLDSSIIGDYERFARSFTEIRAEDIRTQVDALYATGRFWPEPLISINPHYERDAIRRGHPGIAKSVWSPNTATGVKGRMRRR